MITENYIEEGGGDLNNPILFNPVLVIK